jgi:tetratricopeptide (TPR) repeat protein
MKILFTIILICCAAFLFGQNTSTEDTSYENDLEYILTQYYILENYEEALRLLNTYYSDKQNELAYLYGLCYLKLNMNDIAIDYFNTVLAELTNNYEVLNNIGAAYFQKNDFLNAMKYFHLSFIANTDYEIAIQNYNAAYENFAAKENFEEIRPIIPFTEKPTMYNSLGWFYFYAGDFHNAIYYFTKAIEEDDQYQFAYFSLAYVYDAQNNFTTALDFLKQAEMINQTNPDLYNNMGIVYFHLFDFENAEASFRKAISLNSKFAEPHNNLGFLYLAKEEYSLSTECFKTSIALNLVNKNLQAESIAGIALLQQIDGNAEQAKDFKEAAIRLNYQMNSVIYLRDTLQWEDGLIDLWCSI